MTQGDSARPAKRARTDEGESAPKQHIFIADSVTGPKRNGKKAPLSCCECRRLKLKCDRNFPCSSCQKRGVAQICPEGALVSGKGTRFILANTEQLHQKIQDMGERIRDLEDALKQSNGPEHPLLSGQLLKVKSTVSLYQQEDEDTPPSVDSESGAGSPSSSSEQTRAVAFCASPHDIPKEEPALDARHIETEIIRLSHAFPLAINQVDKANHAVRSYIRGILPLRAEAEHLWLQVRLNAHWQYNPSPDDTFFPVLLDQCYLSPIEEVCPRRLALLFMILAVGVLVDLRRQPYSPVAETYHTVARAALSEVSVMEDTDLNTVQALFYEVWYLLMFSDNKKAAGYAWGLMGLASKLAQSIGLHRNTLSNHSPEEIERRRNLFWEMLYLDARLSLSLGRPPSLSLLHSDCPRPAYRPQSFVCALSEEGLHHFQEWKHSCYVHCLAPVLDVVSQPNFDYDKVLELDAKIRDFIVPAALRAKNPQSRAFLMQKASLTTAIETVLLQLHRYYFARVLSGKEGMVNRAHRFIPSCVAVYLSASRMIAIVQDLYDREPELTSRMLGYWSNTFSAAVALCILCSRAPAACLIPTALQELERARSLFNSAKEACPRAAEMTPVLETMIDKANDIHVRWKTTQNTATVYYDEDVTQSKLSREELVIRMQRAGPFRKAHTSLVQCQIEVLQRGKCVPPCRPYEDISNLFANTWKRTPPPQDVFVQVTGPSVLPHANPRRVVEVSENERPRYDGVDTSSIELGAMNIVTDQRIMAWF
ncbi:hypothetical protein CYLTODRAFT_421738 [Cylindrobasidium torrendii FP15055 ss-10]|uniref:Zn(2)-C6 fungal-type domain-containing protein n=1 Tax=Cylindrobasidium torrendii FP15055 ss-10 TaxID=1314674 RepID=A0A0D7BCV6_9AGAR|nr:hypothetical protein CYLTODRAFT_421738 [Cylindrobasidium torrendii FP15055 ss-10]